MKLTEWTTTSFYSAPDFKDKYWRVTSYKDFKSPKLAHDFIDFCIQNEKLRELVDKHHDCCPERWCHCKSVEFCDILEEKK